MEDYLKLYDLLESSEDFEEIVRLITVSEDALEELVTDFTNLRMKLQKLSYLHDGEVSSRTMRAIDRLLFVMEMFEALSKECLFAASDLGDIYTRGE